MKDGIITDPSTCSFDPSKLQGFKPEQIEALKLIYQGAVNPRTGQPIYPGLEPGGEAPQPGNPGWGMIMNGTTPFAIDNAVLGAMGLNNPNWDWKTFDFDRDVALINAKLAGTLNAVNPDLSDFKKGGGKLIVWHGWNDPGVMPQQTLDYFADVVDYAGKSTGGDGAAYTDEYLRLFMLPGVGHCRGGVGPDQADWMAALAGWVEKGTKPATITRDCDARRQSRDDAAVVPASAGRALQRPRRRERRRELRVRRAAVSADPWEQENPRPRAARRGRRAAVFRPAGYRRAARASARVADRRLRRADDAVPDRRRGRRRRPGSPCCSSASASSWSRLALCKPARHASSSLSGDRHPGLSARAHFDPGVHLVVEMRQHGADHEIAAGLQKRHGLDAVDGRRGLCERRARLRRNQRVDALVIDAQRARGYHGNGRRAALRRELAGGSGLTSHSSGISALTALKLTPLP